MKISISQLKVELEKHGYDLLLKHKSPNHPAIELNAFELEALSYILENNLTMTSVAKLVNTMKSCRYVVENDIDGDWVECGVWRGGSSILAKMMFEHLESNKEVWLFDTFEGMTKPTNEDVHIAFQQPAQIKYEQTLNEDHSDWCYASLEDVKLNISNSRVDESGMHLIKGDVCETLYTTQLPKKISILRLDTDWYESSKTEMSVLYPKLSINGVLILDDYGHWSGAKKAVDEYFQKYKPAPMLNVVDYAGRSGIKVC